MDTSSTTPAAASAPTPHMQAFAELEDLIVLTRRRAMASSAFLGLIAENPPADGIHKVSATLLEAIASTLYDVEDTAKELEGIYNTWCNVFVELRA